MTDLPPEQERGRSERRAVGVLPADEHVGQLTKIAPRNQ